MTKRKIAIIPARSGSKRLKNKNLMWLRGQPLVAWTIDAALEANVFDDIILSTDSREILEVGLAKGLTTRTLRPPELATDTATTAELLQFHLVEQNAELCCLLQPTSPLRSGDDIVESLRFLRQLEADAVVSVSEVSHPISWQYDPDIEFCEFISNLTVSRSQDHKIVYQLNGAIYWFKLNSFFKYGTHLIPKNIFPFIMSRKSGIDVDTYDDFLIASTYLASKLERDG